MTASPLTPAYERHLPLPGSFNVRDAGGYSTADGRRVRWRTLLRADSLHRLGPDEQARLRALGLRTIIDLRRGDEVADAPNVFRDAPDVAYHQVSLMGDLLSSGRPTVTLADLYRSILDERPDEMRTVLATLATPGAFPALVHCTAGKDRTGLVVALLLGLAGVPAETIAEDYALTARYLQGEYFEAARRRAEANGHDWGRYRQLLVSPPELMLETLGYIDARHGGIPAYLRRAGLRDDQLERLRQALLAAE